MKITIVTNQAEFDAAVSAGDIIQIYNNGVFFVKGNSQPTIETRDNSQPTIETWGNSQPKIETWDNSQPTIKTWKSNNVRDDLWAICCSALPEIQELRKALIDGRVNGQVYEGECACLVGTIAKAKAKKYDGIEGLVPNEKRPAELWFWNIKKGDTSQNNQFSALAVKWIDELLFNLAAWKAFEATT